MTTLSEAYQSSAVKGHLRALDVGQDLLAVADLVELCFADSLDPDGKDYLQQMREAARSSHLLRWANTYGEYGSMTLGGYVWEEAGRIIGNVSLVPFNSQGKRFFLIANVAVHPNFRGRGIGQALTAAALRYCRDRRVTAAWLQVREDNPVAMHIYKALGFSERIRRTTWLTSAEPREMPNGNDLVLGPRRSQHWLVQRSWLERIYPREMAWHLPVDWLALRPDFLGSVYRFFAFEYPKNWVVQRGNRLLGILTSKGPQPPIHYGWQVRRSLRKRRSTPCSFTPGGKSHAGAHWY
jgi:ribosomal protein S18 acetylase RimI-like enzyme